MTNVMVPDEDILRDVNFLLTHSDPGDSLHHMHIAAAPTNALGLPDLDNIQRSVYAIADDGSKPDFLYQVVVAAGIEQYKNKRTILYAVAGFEMVHVPDGDDLAEQLHKEHRLIEHPRAQEVTVVYGACADGRRWRGRKYLTGPKAGTIEDAIMLIGPPDEQESWPMAQLLRALVFREGRDLLTAIVSGRTFRP